MNMRVLRICLIVVVTCFYLSTADKKVLFSTNDVVTKNKTNFLNGIEEELNSEIWNEKETHCYKEILAIINGVRNSTFWATWIWDSMQLPMGVLYGSQYHLGHYDECIKAPELRTQYCLADVRLTDIDVEPQRYSVHVDPHGSVEDYLNTQSKYGRELNVITWGVCLPSTCGPQSADRILRILLRRTPLPPPRTISIEYCDIAGEKQEDGGFQGFMYFFLFLTLTASCSTIYVSKNNEKLKDNSIVMKIAKSFCMRRNTEDLIKEDNLRTLNGVRALSTIILVLSHYMVYLNGGPIFNGLDVDKFIDNCYYVLNVDLITDSFIVLSGLLTIMGLMAKKDKPESIFQLLLKRYIRLIAVPAITIWCTISVLMQAGSGPLWKRFVGHERRSCTRNWWLNMFMLNNYINYNELCIPVSWYAATDFHLTIFGVAFFNICRSGYHRLRKVTIAFFLVLGLLLPGLVTYWYKLPPTMVLNIRAFKFLLQQDPVFTSVYTKSHYRTSSYLMGMAFGYILWNYKPYYHKNKINQTWSLIIAKLAVVLGVLTMSLAGSYVFREYSTLEASVFAATHRIVWCIALITLIAVCEYGSPTWISKLMTWNAWTPLSRLAYGALLVHPLLIQHYVFSTRTPITERLFTALMDAFGITVMSYLISLVLWLLVQAPLNHLINILLQRINSNSVKSCENNGAPEKKASKFKVN